ncbi:MAG: SUMF1/EgtB/PvdO family nonheme iron enzyme [Lewinellaceae bacterium]|nr:SUMF1/EgtB/PvdO family nonheme iron enzyme [Lewinellaceae bacterium]
MPKSSKGIGHIDPGLNAPKGENFLLAIGINKYEHLPHLSNAVQDAKAFVELLQKRYQFDAEHTKEIYDDEATRKNIYQALEVLVQDVTPKDSVVIYFSGHGAFKNNREEGFWIPVEAEQDAYYDFLPNVLIQHFLGRIKSHHTYVVVDSCFSGTLFAEQTRSDVAPMDHLPSRWLLTSCGNELASDGTPGKHSPFAQNLILFLDRNKDPLLPITFLNEHVAKATQANSAQKPVYGPVQGTGHRNGQFYFRSKEEEGLAWEVVLEANSVQALLSFEKKYPQSTYVSSGELDEAIAKLEEEQLWWKAQHSDSVTGYREYLRRTHKGKYRSQAYEALEQVADDALSREQEKKEAEAGEAQEKKEAEAGEAQEKKEAEEARLRKQGEVEEARRKKQQEEEKQRKIAAGKSKHKDAKKKPVGAAPKPSTSFSWDRIRPILLIGLPIVVVAIVIVIWQIAISGKKTNYQGEAIVPTMISVAGGTFTMGCTSEQWSDCDDDEKPVHQVTVGSFKIGKYEVTQAEWKEVMGGNPSRFNTFFRGCDQCPVERVSWNDIQEFIKYLNQKTGGNYRLPTEAEWEYTVRGGQKRKDTKYAGSDNIDEVAWWSDNSGGKTHPVGQKKPNELGIYDMSGNVWEWCADGKRTYSSESQTNPEGSSGGSRVLRGGSWYDSYGLCRVSDRSDVVDPSYRVNKVGFRLAQH